MIKGSLGSAGVKIPVMSITRAQGEELLALSDSQEAKLELNSMFSFLDGTSMAAPHVVGVIAKVWR